MAPLDTSGAPDPDRRRRFRRRHTPDVRPVAVREALRRFRREAPSDPRERDRLEATVRNELRSAS